MTHIWEIKEDNLMKTYSGFTLAEVLITLGIIGIVAAMTIPGLITKYKAHQLKSQFLKSYSTVQQAFKQMEADDVSLNPKDYDAQTFYKTYQNYFQVAVRCGVYFSKNAPCMNLYKNSYKTLDGHSTVDNHYFDDGQFVLQDGTIIFIENPSIGSNNNYVWVHVDLNGAQKPNKWGYDLFTFEMLDGELRTMGDLQTKFNNLEQYCDVKSSNSYNGIACAHKAKTNADYFKTIIKEFK